MRVYGIQKDGTDESVRRADTNLGNTNLGNRLMDKSSGEEGDDEMNGERSMDALYTNICEQPMGICCMTQGTQTGALS